MTDDRAEQAFRTALADRAASLTPVVLDVRASHRPRRWPLLVSAAAVLLLVAGLASVAVGHRDQAAPAHVLPDGWRWESYANVMVAVPDTWGYAAAPSSDWCASPPQGGLPRGGYVDTRSPYGGVLGIGCGGTPPTSLTRPHLSFLDPRTEIPTPPGWMRKTRTLGTTELTVTIEQSDRDLAQRILATAHVVRRDQFGCTPSSPLQDPLAGRPTPAFDVSTVAEVDSITVCQYGLGDTRAHLGAGLIASQLLTGPRADAELAALQRAGTRGGPDRAQGCGADDRGETGIVLLLRADGVTHRMYALYESCAANGIDDGTHVRVLTRADCAPLFSQRIQIIEGLDTAYARCAPDRG